MGSQELWLNLGIFLRVSYVINCTSIIANRVCASHYSKLTPLIQHALK